MTTGDPLGKSQEGDACTDSDQWMPPFLRLIGSLRVENPRPDPEQDPACKESDEERARALLEVPGRGLHPALEWEDFFRLQRGERLLRNDQLRRANRDFLRGGPAWSEDRYPRGGRSQRPGVTLRALRRMPSGYLRIRT